jgi:hypothetical protein
MGNEAKILHQLIFQCPNCSDPIAVAGINDDRSLEGMDGSVFDLRCECGWGGNAVGARARKHWVDSWP